MAAAHYQFEAIHPHTDGNGRTGRILNVLMLVEAGLLHQPLLWLSALAATGLLEDLEVGRDRLFVNREFLQLLVRQEPTADPGSRLSRSRR